MNYCSCLQASHSIQVSVIQEDTPPSCSDRLIKTVKIRQISTIHGLNKNSPNFKKNVDVTFEAKGVKNWEHSQKWPGFSSHHLSCQSFTVARHPRPGLMPSVRFGGTFGRTEDKKGVKANPPMMHVCATKGGNIRAETIDVEKKSLLCGSATWWSDDVRLCDWWVARLNNNKQISIY